MRILVPAELLLILVHAHGAVHLLIGSNACKHKVGGESFGGVHLLFVFMHVLLGRLVGTPGNKSEHQPV